MPLYSIITPINFIPDTFDLCCKSVLNQTNKSFEWIIVLNGDLIKEEELGLFLEPYDLENIKIINSNDDSGPSKSRNIGIKKSEGRFIVFLDSDDYLDENFLNELLSIIKDIKHEKFAICSEGHKYTKAEGVIGRNNLIFDTKKLTKSEISLNWIGSISGFVVKNNSNIYFDERLSLYEDYNFYIGLMSSKIPIYSSRKLKYFYCISEVSLTKEIQRNYPDRIYKAKKILESSSKKQSMYLKILINMQTKRLSYKFLKKYLKFILFTLIIFLINPKYFYYSLKREIKNMN